MRFEAENEIRKKMEELDAIVRKYHKDCKMWNCDWSIKDNNDPYMSFTNFEKGQKRIAFYVFDGETIRSE